MDTNAQINQPQFFDNSQQWREDVRSVNIFCGISRHDACSGECFCTCHLSQRTQVRGGLPNIVTLAFELREVAKNVPSYWLPIDIDDHIFSLITMACNSREDYLFGVRTVGIAMLGLKANEAYKRLKPTITRDYVSFEETLADIFEKAPTSEELMEAFGEDLRLTDLAKRFPPRVTEE